MLENQCSHIELTPFSSISENNKKEIIMFENILRQVLIVIPLLALIFSGETHAYSVENHKKLTAVAIKVFNQCADNQTNNKWLKSLNDVESFRLVDGSYSEDEDYFDKSTNWHFYDREGLIGRESPLEIFKKIIAEPTMHPRFNQLEITVSNLVKIDGIRSWQPYETVGKLIHYLQDVTVPAHVAPVFHPLNDGFGDSFDDYQVNETELLKKFDVNFCNEMKSLKNKSYNSILDFYANQTFTALNNSIDDLTDDQGDSIKWNVFWNIKTNTRMFGSYGIAGNQYGNKYICIDRNLSFDETIDEEEDGECLHMMRINKSIYDEFANVQHVHAIKATLNAILLSQKQIFEGGNN